METSITQSVPLFVPSFPRSLVNHGVVVAVVVVDDDVAVVVVAVDWAVGCASTAGFGSVRGELA
eukprot:m.174823 g.174823  ORF g.174823 m.174823 type:complete len:64 (-) comp53309_c0_seq1:954-1145(-)